LAKGVGGEARGNAALIAPIISEKFLAEQQFIPVNPMDLW
jgi:hypothetical protein